jgi:DNA-binding beta-propeller fold protein YncE
MSNDKDFRVKNGIKPTAYYEGLGTVVSDVVGYSIGSASYDSVSFSVAAQETSPLGMAFSNDGTKMYMIGLSSDAIHQYSLSTGFDLSTASYDSVSFSVAAQDTSPTGLTFNSDGTKVYVTGAGNDTIYQYSLSTGFGLSTASYDSVSFSVTAQDIAPRDVAFNIDGTKMYIVGDENDSVYQYSLSTGFDLSTASYDSVSFSVAAQDPIPQGVTFNIGGTKMYIVGNTNDSVYQYSLSTGFDLSTASYDSVSFSVATQETVPQDVFFKPDGTKMYIVGADTDTVYQYSTSQTTNTLDLSTGSVFEITPTSDIQVTLSNPAASGTVSGATLLLDQQGYGGYNLAGASYDGVSFSIAGEFGAPTGIAFSNDGTKMYVLDNSSNSVFQYSLSTAFDLSTASYGSVSFSVAAQATGPYGIAFNTDGTKMYVLDNSTRTVFQYSLSTGFDLSTASYDSVSFTATQDTGMRGIAFNTDGTKMYALGNTTDRIYQYSLSTGFDLSTTSYDSVSFIIAGQDTTPTDLAFNTTGTKMYLLGFANDGIFQYSLSTGFDLSTASYDSVSFSVAGQDATPFGIAFKPDGTKMYVLGATNESVYQYSTVIPAIITYDTAIQWPSGTAPTAPAIGDTDVITFTTRDGGSTYNASLAIDGAA